MYICVVRNMQPTHTVVDLSFMPSVRRFDLRDRDDGMPHINIAFLHEIMIIVVVTIIYPINDSELEMKMF